MIAFATTWAVSWPSYAMLGRCGVGVHEVANAARAGINPGRSRERASQQGGAVAARRVHAPEVEGSIPSPATGSRAQFGAIPTRAVVVGKRGYAEREKVRPGGAARGKARIQPAQSRHLFCTSSCTHRVRHRLRLRAADVVVTECHRGCLCRLAFPGDES